MSARERTLPLPVAAGRAPLLLPPVLGAGGAAAAGAGGAWRTATPFGLVSDGLLTLKDLQCWKLEGTNAGWGLNLLGVDLFL